MTTMADVIAAREGYERVALAYLRQQPDWIEKEHHGVDLWAHCKEPDDWFFRLQACEIAIALHYKNRRLPNEA